MFISVYGVKKCSNFILLQAAAQFSQHHLLKRLSFFHCIFFPSLSKVGAHRSSFLHCIFFPPLSKVGAHRSGSSSLDFQSCSTGVCFCFLCQYCTVLMTVALYYSLKSGRLFPPATFFFHKIALAIQYLLFFHTNCELFVSVL